LIYVFKHGGKFSQYVAKMARILAIVHIIVGTLLIGSFVIAELEEEDLSTGYGFFGIWTGVWVSCACVYFHALHAIFDSKRMLISNLKKGRLSI